MLRSMFTAIGGLKNHQVAMDVTANNIANVNTLGYKSQRVSFSSMLSQTMRGASAPDPNRTSYNSYASFEDPDGNGWTLQEITSRLPGREPGA